MVKLNKQLDVVKLIDLLYNKIIEKDLTLKY